MADRNPNPENVSKDSNSAELKSADDTRFDVEKKKRKRDPALLSLDTVTRATISP